MRGTRDAERIRPGSSPGAGGWPPRLAGAWTAAIGLFGRSLIALVGLSVVGGAVVPWHEPEGRTGAEPGATSPDTSTITLTIADGEAARSLTVVDESGRELAALTRWRNGTIGLSARRDGGTGIWSGIRESGETFANLVGTTRQTFVEARPDGTAKSTVSDLRDAGPPERLVSARHASVFEGRR